MLSLPTTLEHVAFGEAATGDRRVCAERLAHELFHKLRLRSWLGGVCDRLFVRSNRLLELTSVATTGQISGQHYRGIHTVPIKEICGSEGRCDDFDASFRPLHAHDESRWSSVATAFQLGVSLPPVELIAVGNMYFVRDGHHRISVALAFGQGYIDAAVTVWSV